MTGRHRRTPWWRRIYEWLSGYDWVEDDSLPAEETLRRFKALRNVPYKWGQ